MAYILGQVVHLTATFRDSTGVLIDPTTPVVNITIPAGTTSALTAVRDSVGLFHYDYTPATTGIYTWWFSGTGVAQPATEFTVTPAGVVTDLLTLAEGRSALRIPASDTGDDADILAYYIPAVTPIVEDLTGPILAVTGLTWTVDGGTTTILLPSAVTAVTSVTEDGQPLVPNVDYVAELRSGMVVRGSVMQPYIFLPGQQNIVITYDVGTGVIPPNVKLAARIILRQLWLADQTGEMPAYAQADAETVQTPSGFAIPKRAFELLQAGPQDLPGFG